MPSLRKYVLNLAAAGSVGDIQRLDVSGPLVAVLDSTATFNLLVDSNAPLPAERGLKFRWPFSAISAQNTKAVAITVTLLIGDGEVEDYRPASQLQGPTTSALLYSNYGTGAAVALAAAEANRCELIMKSSTTSTLPIDLTAGVGGSRIATVYPGELFRINWRGPVAISATATEFVTVTATYY